MADDKGYCHVDEMERLATGRVIASLPKALGSISNTVENKNFKVHLTSRITSYFHV